jgi:hypothetical protein
LYCGHEKTTEGGYTPKKPATCVLIHGSFRLAFPRKRVDIIPLCMDTVLASLLKKKIARINSWDFKDKAALGDGPRENVGA